MKFPSYYTDGASIVVFKNATEGLLINHICGNFEMKEIIVDEDWLEMFVENGQEVSKEDFAFVLLKATKAFESYFSPELMNVEFVCDGVGERLTKVYKQTPWHTTAMIADMFTYFNKA